MSTIRTSLPIPTQPWEAARAKFLEGLSPQEIQRFKDATPENLFYDASAVQKRHADNSKTWLFQERLSSLTDAINDYGKALDVYANANGLILSPIWGSVRVVLHVSPFFSIGAQVMMLLYNIQSFLTLSADCWRSRQVSGKRGGYAGANRRCTPTFSHIPNTL